MDKSPDAFRTISEAADDLGLPQHVLRFWETRFPQIKPLKRGGGRRYYRPDDVELLRAIKQLLYDEGYTIKGVQRLFKEQGARVVVSVSQGKDSVVHARDVELYPGDAPAERSTSVDEASIVSADTPRAADFRAALSSTDLQALRDALAQIGESERILALVRG
jgi:DNA-binding transcriptional MerR regulator